MTHLAHPYDLPGPKIFIPVANYTEAEIEMAKHHEAYLYESHLVCALYVIVPVKIEPVSYIQINDVWNVLESV